jgi:hypothetical protein
MGVAAAAAGIGAAGAIGGSLISSSASKSAANTQAEAAQQAAQLQAQQYQQTQANLAPYMSLGTNAIPFLQNALGLGPGGSGQINPTQFIASPGYQFQMQQGLQGVNAAAAARGGVNSGNTMKALTSFGQGLAGQNFQQYLNNLYQTIGGGQNAAASLGGFGANSAMAQGNFGVGAGNALAAGQVGSANALSGGLGAATNPYLLASLFNSNGGGGSTAGVDSGSWTQF